MTSPSGCPDVRQLQRLLAGLVPGAEAERLERHLAGCDSCRRAVQVLPFGNPLAEALDGCAAAALSSEANRAADTVVRHFEGEPAARETDGSGDPTPLHGDYVGAGARLGRFDFLAPPQQAGEIGRLGPFRVLGGIGIGGMGVVLRAHEPLADRVVALKVMQPRLAGDESHRQRFLREARAAAGLRHDHVVTVYHVGEDRGVLYLAMELLQGESLADRLRREKRLAPAEAARIGRQAALGLAAAHERGLTHRDVKPANLWLEAGTGRVKVLDFGLSLPADNSDPLTGSGLVPGTVHFMAPEQARYRASEVGTWTDVYGLGVVLYQMLTGRLPLEGPPLEVVHRIGVEAPLPPSHFRDDLDPGLESIVLKAMAERPGDRYPGGRELAEALADWSSGGAQAPPAAPAAAQGAPGRRRRVPLLVKALAGILLLAGCAFAAQMVIRVRDRDGKVITEVPVPEGGRVEIVPDAKTQDKAAGAGSPRDSARPGKAAAGATGPAVKAAAQAAAAAPGRPEIPGLLHVLGNPAWRHWMSGSGSDAGLAFTDAKQVAVWSHITQGQDRFLRIRDAATGEKIVEYKRPAPGPVHSVPAYFDGGTAALFSGENETWSVKLWDITGRREPVTLSARGSVPTSLSVSRDGHLVAAGMADGRVWLWDASTGEQLGDPLPVEPGVTIQQVALSPKGDLLAAAVARVEGDRELGHVHLWDPRQRKDRGGLSVPAIRRCSALAFTPDGGTLAVQGGPAAGILQLWFVTAARLRMSVEHQTCFALCNDSVACGGPDGVIRQYTLDDRLIREFHGHSRPVTAVVFSPDRQQLVSLSTDDGSVRQWDVKTAQQVNPVDRAIGPARFVAMSPDGSMAAVGRGGGLLQFWDTASGKSRDPMQTPAGHCFMSAAFSPDNKLLAASTTLGEVWIWDVVAQERLITLRGLEPSIALGSVTFSPDGKTLACSCVNAFAHLWETAPGRDGWIHRQPRPDLKGRTVSGTAFVPLPGSVATASSSIAINTHSKKLASIGDGCMQLWDLETGREMTRLDLGRGALRGLACSGDGKRLACGTEAGAVLVWEFTGEWNVEERPVRGTVGPVVATAFAPDALTLYTASSDGQIARWAYVPALKAWEKQGLWLLPGPVYGMDLSADRRHAVTANGDGTAYVLRLDP
jgi:WD40 repeat protein